MGTKKKKKTGGVSCGFPLIKLIKAAANQEQAEKIIADLNTATQHLLKDVESRSFPVRTPEQISLDEIHTRFCSMFSLAHDSGIQIKAAIDKLPKKDFGQLQQTVRKSRVAKNL